MKSQEYKNKLMKSIEDIANDTETMYWSIRKELKEELDGIKVATEKVDTETNKIYDQLDEETCIYLIKKELPWHVRLFNDIHYTGKCTRSGGGINIYFSFSDFSSGRFQYEFRLDRIKELLAIK